MKKQQERILRHMRKAGPITGLQAITELGCMDLDSRIASLVKDGHTFESDTVQTRNQFGEFMGKFTRYWLKGNPPKPERENGQQELFTQGEA
ncbi:MAG: helix-turn-helix domain-containing protein [Planctomycetota bacterium]|jgi:hypothetical protein